MSADPQPDGLWTYRARVEAVVDGDTLDLTLDLGFGTLLTGDEGRVRLDGIDTGEIFGRAKESDEYQRGQTHKEFVEEWVTDARDAYDGDWPFLVKTYDGDERGKYGRYIARIVSRANHDTLNDALVQTFGDEVRYDG